MVYRNSYIQDLKDDLEHIKEQAEEMGDDIKARMKNALELVHRIEYDVDENHRRVSRLEEALLSAGILTRLPELAPEDPQRQKKRRLDLPNAEELMALQLDEQMAISKYAQPQL